MLLRLGKSVSKVFAGKFKKKFILEEREGNEQLLAKENKTLEGYKADSYYDKERNGYVIIPYKGLPEFHSAIDGL